jgi:hypothetical protein
MDLLKFRLKVENSNSKIKYTTNEIQKIMDPLIKVTSDLIETNQSIFLQCIEKLEINSQLRLKIKETLEKSTQNCDKLAHAIVLVGTKYAELYSKTKQWKLSSRDILLLIIFTQSLLKEDFKSTSQNIYLNTKEGKLQDCFITIDYDFETDITLIFIANDEVNL